MHGVVNLLKPPGMTSHDAVAFVRRVMGLKKVGHTGTLDPAAAGVLPICVGQATRLAEYLQAGTKEYIAEATFGSQTDSGDLLGETILEADFSHVNLENLRQILDQFRGKIEQTPPLHSAIKVGGKKLYELARAGETIEIPTRQVTISRIFVTRWESPRATIHIECSGGTYIRSLVRDLGLALDSAATMTFLVRTRSGGFSLDEAVACEEFAAKPELMPMAQVLGWCARSVVIDDDAAKAMSEGRVARLEKECEETIVVGNVAQTLFALARRDGESFRPEKVFDLR